MFSPYLYFILQPQSQMFKVCDRKIKFTIFLCKNNGLIWKITLSNMYYPRLEMFVYNYFIIIIKSGYGLFNGKYQVQLMTQTNKAFVAGLSFSLLDTHTDTHTFSLSIEYTF